jgi:hypothetical protein
VLRWARRNGRIDAGTTPISLYDKVMVICYGPPGAPEHFSLLVVHVDGTVSQHIDTFTDFSDCRYIGWHCIEYRHIENAVWFDATEMWTGKPGYLNELMEEASREKSSIETHRSDLPP